MSPNDFIKHLTIKKTPWDNFTQDEQKTYLPYIMNLWLSMVPDLIETINFTQTYQVSSKDHYNFYLKLLPKKSLWMRWVKGKKKLYSNELFLLIASYYKVGKKDIKDSLEILEEENIIYILKQLGKNEKQIKKLIK